MLAAAAEAGRQIQARSRQESDQAVEAMKARGLTVHGVPPEAEAEWRRLAESAYPQVRGKMVPADMFDEVVRLLKEHRGARK
jgi:TRAP-type C4-dicarboxylate transport system substrate-binding protein